MCLDIDVAAANSLVADRDIAVLTSSSFLSGQSTSSQQRTPHYLGPNTNAMNTPSQVVMSPLPLSSPSYSERERAFSEPEYSQYFKDIPPSASPPLASTPNEEIDDPLSHHWRQSPKRSSSLFRRLSRSSHRRSGSLPGDLRRSLSDPAPESRKEDEEDVFSVPEQLQRGMEMLRVTRKKVTKRICWIDPISACVAWDSKNSSKCNSHSFYSS